MRHPQDAERNTPSTRTWLRTEGTHGASGGSYTFEWIIALFRPTTKGPWNTACPTAAPTALGRLTSIPWHKKLTLLAHGQSPTPNTGQRHRFLDIGLDVRAPDTPPGPVRDGQGKRVDHATGGPAIDMLARAWASGERMPLMTVLQPNSHPPDPGLAPRRPAGPAGRDPARASPASPRFPRRSMTVKSVTGLLVLASIRPDAPPPQARGTRLAEVGTVVYSNDFNGPVGSTYPEWSAASYSWTGNEAGTIAAGSATEVIGNIESYNSAQRFLGELGGPPILKGPPYDARHFVRVDESITLSLGSLPPHGTLTVAFDLYILKSWDGNNPIYGPDYWTVAVVGGPTLLKTTFSNNFKTGRDLSLQDYPFADSPPQKGASGRNQLGYDFWFGDAVYPMTFSFAHSADSVKLVFSSSLNEGKSERVHSTRDESWGLDNLSLRAR